MFRKAYVKKVEQGKTWVVVRKRPRERIRTKQDRVVLEN